MSAEVPPVVEAYSGHKKSDCLKQSLVPRIGLDNRWHLGRLILLGCYLLPQIIVLMEQVCLKISFRHIVPNPDNLRLKHPRYGLLSAAAVVRVRYL